MKAILDSDDLRGELQRFAEQTPRTLRRLKLTEEIASEVERTLTIAESPFTMAVVGQMRVGKSTLINAMVGAELAIPGVTETTATVNWFRHGSPEQAGKFRIVWNDLAGTSEERDLAERDLWSGNSELAARTRYLEFFSTAEFLRKVHVVDTPGTRSTLQSHEESARGFLLSEGKSALDSQFYGGVADCIVYVLPPVTHLNDSDLLGEFTAQRRMLRSTASNSVAVLHKWETLEHRAPWDAAAVQAQRAFQALGACVCDVIPVSGPLALAASHCPPQFWNDALRLVRSSSRDTLETLTMKESWFVRPVPDCPLNPEERAGLRSAANLAWPCFKTLLALAGSRPFADGPELQRAVREASGIDKLLEMLDRRFFSRSRMIRASNVVSRALRMADLARGRMRSRMGELEIEGDMGREALAEIETTDAFPRAGRFLRQRVAALQQEFDQVDGILRELEAQLHAVREGFEHFERDLQSIQCLDDHPDEFDRAEAVEILRLLGAYGHRLSDRLGGSADRDLLEPLFDRLDRWLVLRHAAKGKRRSVLDQVVLRLEAVMLQLKHSLPTQGDDGTRGD